MSTKSCGGASLRSRICIAAGIGDAQSLRKADAFRELEEASFFEVIGN